MPKAFQQLMDALVVKPARQWAAFVLSTEPLGSQYPSRMSASQSDFDKNQNELDRIQQRIESFKAKQANLIKRAQDQSDAETQRANDRETERRRFLEKEHKA